MINIWYNSRDYFDARLCDLHCELHQNRVLHDVSYDYTKFNATFSDWGILQTLVWKHRQYHTYHSTQTTQRIHQTSMKLLLIRTQYTSLGLGLSTRRGKHLLHDYDRIKWIAIYKLERFLAWLSSGSYPAVALEVLWRELMSVIRAWLESDSGVSLLLFL